MIGLIKSTRGLYRDYIGSIMGLIKRDARSLDYSSAEHVHPWVTSFHSDGWGVITGYNRV